MREKNEERDEVIINSKNVGLQPQVHDYNDKHK